MFFLILLLVSNLAFSNDFLKEILSLKIGGGYPIGEIKNVKVKDDILIYSSDSILCIDEINNGYELNSIIKIPLYNLISSIEFYEDFLYVGFRNGEVICISIKDKNNPKIIWKDWQTQVVRNLIVNNNYLYIIGTEILIYDISKKENPVYLNSLYLDESIYDMKIFENKGFAISFSGIVWVIDLSSPSNPKILKERTFGSGEIWFSKIEACNGYLYISKWGGFDYFDIWILDENNLELANIIYLYTTSNIDFSINKNLLGICFEKGFQIYDISTPSNPKFVSAYPIERAQCLSFNDCYAYIGTQKGFIYLLSIANPYSFDILGRISADPKNGAFFKRGSTMYLATPQNGLSFYDFSNPLAPVLVSNFPYLGKKTILNGNLLYFVTSSGFTIFDISDLSNIKQLGYISLFTSPNDLALKDNIIYFSHDYGFLIYDVSNPYDIKLLASKNLGQGLYKIEISEKEIIVKGEKGIFFISSENKNEVEVLNYLEIDETVEDILYFNDVLFLSTKRSIEILDITNPYKIHKIGSYLEDEFDLGLISAYQNYLLVKATNQSIRIVDISDIQNPKKSGFFYFFQFHGFNGFLTSIKIYQRFIYVSFWNEETFILQLNNSGGIFLKNLERYPEIIVDFKIKENFAFILSNKEIISLDISNKNNFNTLDSFQILNANILNINENYCYVRKNDEVLIFDISNPADLKYISSFYIPNLFNIYFGKEIGVFTHSDKRVTLFSTENPLEPNILSQINTNEKIYSITFYKNMLLLSGDEAIYLYDISNPSSPYFLCTWKSDIWGDKYGMGSISIVNFKDNILIFPDWYEIHFIDISDPLQPVLLFNYRLDNYYFYRVDVFKNYLLAKSYYDLFIIDISDLENIKEIKKIDYIMDYELIYKTKNIELYNGGNDFFSLTINFSIFVDIIPNYENLINQ